MELMSNVEMYDVSDVDYDKVVEFIKNGDRSKTILLVDTDGNAMLLQSVDGHWVIALYGLKDMMVWD